jgi:hypothetical protein
MNWQSLEIAAARRSLASQLQVEGVKMSAPLSLPWSVIASE